MSKSSKVLVAALVAVLLVGAAGAWYVLRPAESTASLDAVAGSASPPGSDGPARTSPDGRWRIQRSEAVFAGYRVDEVLRGLSKTAVGRTPAVDGTMAVAGTAITEATVTADLSQLASDSGQRDSQIRHRGLETSQFPQATFTLTQPVALPAAPQHGQELELAAVGDLTLHGVTRPVTAPLRARWDGNQVTVATAAGGLPIQFADYGIQPFDIAGIVKTEDHGSLELQLLFVPA